MCGTRGVAPPTLTTDFNLWPVSFVHVPQISISVAGWHGPPSRWEETGSKQDYISLMGARKRLKMGKGEKKRNKIDWKDKGKVQKKIY